MPNTVRILRSTTPGATPSALVSGQIAVNEADGRLFYRSAAGAVTTYSNVVEYASPANFPATGTTGRLYLTAAGRIYRWVSADSVYAEVGTIGGLTALDGGSYS